MAQKSKKFRVATEGATTDGRRIERSWIEQMSKNFDPKKYGARVWLEHMRGMYPDSAFKAYGDVLSVEARAVEDGKLALFAEISPLPDLVAMTTKEKQKIYTSIEVNPKFADTNEAYLVGLAVTDSPASLGTEVLSFAAQHPDANPFKSRKTSPDTLFSEALEVTLEFEDDAPDTSLLDRVKTFGDTFKKKFAGFSKKTDDTVGELLDVVEEMGEAMGDIAQRQSDGDRSAADLLKKFTALEAKYSDLDAKFKTIDTTEAGKHSQRPPATGGDPATQKTDC
ncbi:Phage capsid scaffolding protein (GPO) serine peptidase [Variovorax sp. OK605]|uniref:GPO family capsid scaffolding protein n=1 Tax=Variovorax sp. OK605 TaxID=1855317 RepID=UPI0008E5E1E8|nr:GPO family capsid scaffolding protein [Variovorax sp. OK605]SFO51775.1 Phage capsid scaffolding protein (GPO) serine peptidase [Variovorax sp. OK605]